MDTYETEFVDMKQKNLNCEIKNEPKEDNLTNLKCGDIYSFNGRQFTFSCYFCSIQFTEYEIFTNHILGEHSKLFLYDDCAQQPDFEALIEEMPTKHFSNENSEVNCENLLPETGAPNTDIQSSSESNTTSIICNLCGKSFSARLGLVRHKNRYKLKTCITTGAAVPIAAPKEFKQKLRRHKCNYCNLLFRCPSEVKVHERRHTGEMPFPCEICKKVFRTKHQLEKHTIIHGNTRPYKCSYCPSAFNHPANLTVHIRRLHLGERPHKCELCEKTFVTSTEKTSHMRLHTEEKPFQCEECGSKFRMAAQLTIHKNIRHNEEKKFECTECDKKFKTNKCLRGHMVTHSDAKPFSCETCGATFARKKALIAHEKLHSDVKEYVCKICGKEFAQNAGLYSHMKSHKIDNEFKVQRF